MFDHQLGDITVQIRLVSDFWYILWSTRGQSTDIGILTHISWPGEFSTNHSID